MESWTEHMAAAGLSATTVADYEANLHQFELWFKETNGMELDPIRLTPTDVREYRDHCLAVKRLAPASINARLSAVRAWTRWAVATGKIQDDPTAAVKSVSAQQLAPRWLDRRQQLALVRAAERRISAARTPTKRRLAIRDTALLVFLLNTGLRLAEVIQLQLDDVHLSDRAGEVRVWGKGQRYRRVPLNLTARQAIATWMEQRGQVPGHLWMAIHGKTATAMDRRSVIHVIASISAEAGVDATPHTLRHSCAKSMVDAGVSLDRVAAILGHKSMSTTAIYTVPGERDLQQALDRLGGDQVQAPA